MWNCSRCTYINEDASNNCSMCLGPKKLTLPNVSEYELPPSTLSRVEDRDLIEFDTPVLMPPNRPRLSTTSSSKSFSTAPSNFSSKELKLPTQVCDESDSDDDQITPMSVSQSSGLQLTHDNASSRTGDAANLPIPIVDDYFEGDD